MNGYWILPTTPDPTDWNTTGQAIAEFSAPIEKMEVRNGRLMVYSGGMWHIVPIPKDARA